MKRTVAATRVYEHFSAFINGMIDLFLIFVNKVIFNAYMCTVSIFYIHALFCKIWLTIVDLVTFRTSIMARQL